ncbi:1052_t:CDS:2 [Ambispora leptoticha]|uniref:1052_t:CDS:1 n=1 Tax=Ambispora leptoticha TaxID=144679 RepID=A0A9N9FS22_9GLOM|nr:1052_t:CDS:2 [Ambispora leptoticha]
MEFEYDDTPLSYYAFLVCEILSNLDSQVDLFSCSLVSRLWNTCATPLLWKAPILKRYSTLQKFIATLYQNKYSRTTYSYGCLIQKLDLSRLANNIPAAELGLISESSAVLKYLDFSNVTELREESLCRIAIKCTQLRSIKLINLPHITDHSLQQLLQRCQNLECLAIGDCTRLTNAGLIEIANHAHSLTTLEIYLTNTPTKHTFSRIIKSCRNLKNLHIWDCVELDDASALTIAENLAETLESLILHNPPKLTDTSLTEIATNCKNLRHFGLEPHGGVTNATLIALANNAHNLKSLKLSLRDALNITNDGFLALADRLDNLSNIQIQESRSKNITDVSLSMLAIRGARTLTSLHIYNSSFSDSLLRVIESNQPPINDLCLFGLANITDQPLIALLRSISGTLTSLQISYCDQITEDVYVNGLGVYGGNLKKLSLFPSNEITIDGLRAISTGCSGLKEFYLASTEDAPASLIPVVISRLRDLEELRIRNCPNMEVQHIHTILCGCRRLKEFFLGRSRHVTQEFVDEYNMEGKGRPLLVLGP